MINIVVLIAVIVIVVLAVFVQIRNAKKGGCSCGCGGSCSSGCADGSEKAADKNTVYPASSSLVLDIDGMHCEKCSTSVSAALNNLDGVAAEVDLQNRSAVVTLSKSVGAEVLKEAVAEKGFEVVRIRTVE